MSDSSISSEVELSEPENRFVPQENDHELLWEVIEITAERGRKYKVKWAGINPKTKKAWPQEWVAKHDCTDDIVKEWKAKQAKKKRGKGKANESFKARQKPKKAGKPRVEMKLAYRVSSRGQKQTTERILSVDGDDGWEAGKNKGSKKRVMDDVESNNEEEGEDEEEAGKDEGDREEEEDTPTPAVIVKVGPPRGVPRKLSRKPSMATSTSSKKAASNKDTTSIASKGNSYSGKVASSILGKRKSRAKEGVESDSPSEGDSPRKPSKRRFSPAHQHSTNTIGDYEVVEITDSFDISDPKLSPAARTRLAAFDATQLSIEDDPIMLSPERIGDHPDSNENMQDDDNSVKSVALATPPGPEHSDNAVSDLGMAPNHRSNEIVTKPQSVNNSYRTGIVPETETESSTNNTQSQPDRRPYSPSSSSRLPHPTANPATPLPRPRSPETPPRTPIKSRMKPRTPGSSSNVFPLLKTNAIPDVDVNVKQKALQRVPVVSPSIFHPHLPSDAPAQPGGSNVESVIEPAPEPEVEYPASSIEEFSPDKSLTRAKRSGHDDGDRMIRERGQVLADMAIRQKHRAKKTAPKTLTDILVEEAEKTKATTSKRKPSSKRDLNQPPPGSGLDSGLLGNVPVDMDVAGPSGSGIEDAIIVQEMEDRYVDLDGGAMDVDQDQGAAALDLRVLLRQEEEESSQDLLADRCAHIHVDAEAGGTKADIIDDGVREKAVGAVEPSQHNGDGVDEDQLALDTKDPARREARSRSRSAHSLDKAEKKSQPELALSPMSPMASTGHILPNLQSRLRSQTHPPAKYHSTSITQSGEISRLEQMLEAERSKTDALATEITFLKDALAQASAAAASDAANLQQQCTEARDQHLKDGAAWDAERSALASSLDALKQAKLSAESDRDFFREQYGQASGYVSSVRLENEELETRATIAEKQAKDGVNMIRNTFQGKIKALEDELKQCKGLVALLTEKDRRTGDEIRRKAGEEPELRMRCDKLEQVAEKLTEENASLVAKLDETHRGKEALEQALQEREEYLARVERAYKLKTEGLITSDALGGEDDLAYRCEWRLNKNMPCEGIFSDTEGLRNHVLGEHLH